jgi:hypothetical protein
MEGGHFIAPPVSQRAESKLNTPFNHSDNDEAAIKKAERNFVQPFG